jgi:Na+/proline symporter
VGGARAAFAAIDNDVSDLREAATTLAREVSGDRDYSDVNYVFPTFVLTQLPIGLIGLMMVAIVLAATDSIAAELNSLSTATVIDFYRRYVTATAGDAHYLRVSRYATAFWGVFASLVAIWAAELGSLIEVVNRFGSFFYGSILGVFLLAFLWPPATGTGAFVGLVAGMSAVAWVATTTGISFLWHNVIGAVVVFAAGVFVSAVAPARRAPARTP